MTTKGRASVPFTGPACRSPDTLLRVAGVVAVVISVKLVDNVPPPSTAMDAATVLVCALVPAVNVAQACPFAWVTALAVTEDNPVPVGATEKLTVPPTTNALLLVTSAHNWLVTNN